MLAFYLFAYCLSWLFLSTEGWCGKMGMCFLRDCDLNGCMFAVASNLFVWLPGVAGTISIQSNCYVVINTYFTSLQLELSKFLVLFLWKWDLVKYSLLLEHSFQFSHLVVFDSLWLHGLQHARLLWPPLSPRALSNSCPLSQWCYLTISSSAAPFSLCLQSFPL